MKLDFQNTTGGAGLRATLRKQMLARRLALDPSEHARLSARVVAHLLQLPAVRPGSCIGFCWPIRNEPDIRGAIEHWRAKHACQSALPVSVEASAPLRFRAWSPDTPLLADRHGIPTPSEGSWLTPDILLLPVNAFDAAGYRLGYGGGYFDRTLASMQPRPLAIGVGFELNRVDSIHPEPHDQKLDWMVTEAGAVAYDA